VRSPARRPSGPNRGVAYYNMIGQTAAAALTFNGDKARFDKAGATEMAQLGAQELVRINSRWRRI
jgi:hypothetical protein